MQRINIGSPQFEYDAEDPEGFRSGLARLGNLFTAAEESGTSVYELPPGQAVCPYHYECGEEEWLLVLEGNPTLRHPDGSERLDPWDVVFFSKGPAGAHGIRNETGETARVLMFSTVVVPTATVYPDSDKVGIWTGDPESDLLVRRESKVDYFDGET
ncbi:MAG TPA: cupin domain-containing protein [Solirubrobacterales bacterium]|nr:cupin domain-containing protein [Solirubrobacterales bacterium]